MDNFAGLNTVNKRELAIQTATKERMRRQAKQCNKRENWTYRHMLDSYLIEFMWRQKIVENTFRQLIEQIFTFYNVYE